MGNPDDLLRRAKRGDHEALRALLKLHGPRARAAIHDRIAPQWRSVLSEEDVLQVAFMEAFLHIEQLEAESEAGFASWLTRITTNTLQDAIRGLSCKKRPPPFRQTAMGGDESYEVLLEGLIRTTSTPSRQAARGESKQMLDMALDALPPDYGKVVRLYDLEGRAVAEVAVQMGRSEGAVYMLRGRAHERLREILGASSKFFSDSQ